ncbi:MAG TPA: KUP/HAK/KT family potassium transporter, partial [Pirellulales bacterium]|nr:KUP/HAK/KT family potassium transporter [Pirellulales bacterium]
MSKSVKSTRRKSSRTASEAATAKKPEPHTLTLVIGALGVVYGDIGTSPLYTLPVCFAKRSGVSPDPENVLGILSLIIWSLVIIVSVKYLAVILRADLEGEGGILALSTLITSSRPKAKNNRWLLPLGLFGSALLLGDAMITPAMSVLSAVEGVKVVQPVLQKAVVPICIAILLLLFFVQRHGTEKIGSWFGPIMLCWFFVLAALGIYGIWLSPQILLAINPLQGARFLIDNLGRSLFVLGFVFLAVTGGEALYADLGHFGKRPIRVGWFAIAFPALLLNYLGQGGLLLSTSSAAAHSFFQLAPNWLQYPLILLATVATVIASQAVVSGTFSLMHQARQFGYIPRLEVVHYSGDGEGKVYVPLVNWCLAAATIALVLTFRSSDALAGAYGMAVSGTMLITTVLIVVCFRRLWKWNWLATVLLAALFLTVDSAFLVANLTKFLQGGWIPLTIAAAIYLVMSTWRIGRVALKSARYVSADVIQQLHRDVKAGKLSRVSGTAIYFSSDPTAVPITLLVNCEHNR